MSAADLSNEDGANSWGKNATKPYVQPTGFEHIGGTAGKHHKPIAAQPQWGVEAPVQPVVKQSMGGGRSGSTVHALTVSNSIQPEEHKIGFWDVIHLIILPYTAPFEVMIEVLPSATEWIMDLVSPDSDVMKASAMDYHQWLPAGDDILASNGDNWFPATAPEAGDSVNFTDGDDTDCTWDLAISLDELSMEVNYAGTITQVASFSADYYYQDTGVFVGDPSYTLTVYADFYCANASFHPPSGVGKIVNFTLRLVMSGDGGNLTLPSCYLYDLTLLDNTSLKIYGGVGTYVGISNQFTTTAGKTLTLDTVATGFSIYDSAIPIATLRGTIAGVGSFCFVTDAASRNIPDLSQVTITCPVEMKNNNSGSAKTLTATSNIVFGNVLSFVSTITLDLTASNYALTTAGIVIGTDGFLNGRGSVIECSGNWDSSAGTFTYGTSTLNMTGASKTIKTASAGTLYDLNISGTTSTVTNSFTIAHNITVTSTGTFSVGSGLSVTFTTSGAGIWTNRGTVNGVGTLNIDYTTADTTIIFGTVNIATIISALAGADADRICSIDANTIFGSSIVVSSAHGSYTMTLDLTGSNYALSATDITIGTRGILLGRASQITCSSNWDSSAGVFTYGTSNLIMAGPSKTLKMILGQSLYDLNVTGTVTLLSAIAATHTITVTGGTLDLSGTNYALTAAGITIGASGVINGRDSIITCSGNWDSSLGTFTKGTSTVIMSGVGKTLKTATTGFYTLNLTGSSTFQSHIWASNSLNVTGTVTQATYRLNVSGSASNALIATGSWDGSIYLNGTGLSYSVTITAPFTATGMIYSKVITMFTNGTNGNITVTPPVATYGAMHISKIDYDAASPAKAIMFDYTLSAGTATFTVIVLPNWYYKIYVGGVFTVKLQANGLGSLTWTHDSWSDEFFNLTGSASFLSIWKQTTGNLASTDANWLSGVTPEAGDDVLFNDTSVADCTWNLAIILATFIVANGYTGTITPNTGFSTTDDLTPCFTGSTFVAGSYTYTCGGDWDSSLGTFTQGTSVGIMSGSAKTFKTSNGFETLTFSGSYTLLSDVNIVGDITITGALSASTFAITCGGNWDSSVGSFTYGTSNLIMSGATKTLKMVGGQSLYDLNITGTIALLNVINIMHALTVIGGTLDLSASNYALNATDITVGAGGLLNGRGSTIRCAGNWDSSVGSFTKGTSTVIMSGVAKTIKVSTVGFYALNLTGSITLQSEIWASSALNITGTVTQATYRMNVSGSASNALTATGSWDGSIYLNGTGLSYSVAITAPFTATGVIYSKVITTFTNSTTGYIIVTPPAGVYGAMHISRVVYDSVSPTNIVIFDYTLASGSASFTILTQANWYEKIYVGGVFYDKLQSNGAGILTWTYGSWSKKFFNVTGSSSSGVIWKQTSGNLASTNANWLGGLAPTTGDDVTFSSISTAACTWDLSILIVIDNFYVTSGYTGTITPSVGITTYHDMTPCFTGSTFVAGTFTYTVGGNWDSSTGTFTYATSTVNMTGVSRTLKTGSGGLLYNLNISGTISTITYSINLQRKLTVTSTGTLSIGTGLSLTMVFMGASGYWSNAGTVAGPGTLIINTYSLGYTVIFGTITAPTTLTSTYNNQASLLTAGANAAFPASLTITFGGNSGSGTFTFDLSASNYALTVTDLTVTSNAYGTGNLNCRGSKIIASGNVLVTGVNGQIAILALAASWFNVTGTFTTLQYGYATSTTGTINFTASSTISIANINTVFYNMNVAYAGQVTTLITGSVYLKHTLNLNGGTLTPGAYLVQFYGGTAYSITGTGTFNPSTYGTGSYQVLVSGTTSTASTFASSISLAGIAAAPAGGTQGLTYTVTQASAITSTRDFRVTIPGYYHIIWNTGGYALTTMELVMVSNDLNGQVTLSLGASAVSVNGNVTLTRGVGPASNLILNLNSATVAVARNWTSSGTVNGGTSTVDLTGSAIISLSAGTFYNLNLAYTGKTVTLTTHLLLMHTLDLNDGILTPGAYMVQFYGGTVYSITGTGTFNPSTYLTGSYHVLVSGPTNTASTFASSITLAGIAATPYGTYGYTYTVNQASAITSTRDFRVFCGGLYIVWNTGGNALTTTELVMITNDNNGQATLSLGASVVTISGNVTLTRGIGPVSYLILNLNTATITVARNWTNTGTVNGGTSVVDFTGSAIITPGTGSFYNLNLAYTGKTVTLVTANLILMHTLDLNDGILEPGAFVVQFYTTGAAAYSITGSGTFNPSTYGTGSYQVLVSRVSVSADTAATFQSSIALAGIMATNGGNTGFTYTVNQASALTITREFKVSCTANSVYIIWNVLGYALTTVDLSLASSTSATVTLNLAASTVVINGNVSLSTSSSSSILNLNTATVTIGRNFTSTGTVNGGTSTVDFTGSATITMSAGAFYNLNLAYIGKTITLTNHLSLMHTLDLNDGILTPGAYLLLFTAGTVAYSITGTGTFNPSTYLTGSYQVQIQGATNTAVTFSTSITLAGIAATPYGTAGFTFTVNQASAITSTRDFRVFGAGNSVNILWNTLTYAVTTAELVVVSSNSATVTLTLGSGLIMVTGNVSVTQSSSTSTLNGGTSTLNMTGTGRTMSVIGTVYNLNISGGTVSTITNSFTISHALTVTATSTFSIGSGVYVVYVASGGVWTNRGIVSGLGTLYFDHASADVTITFGTVNVATQIRTTAAAGTNRICALGANVVFGSTLTIISAHGSNTMTLDLSASNYALSATDITISTRGVINGRAGIIRCSGNWYLNTGAFTYATSTVNMTGASKTINHAGSFYSLNISGTISLLTSSFTTYGHLTITSTGTLAIGTGLLVVFTAVGATWTNRGSINGLGTVYLDYTTADTTITFGVVNTAVIFRGTAGENANRICTLGANAVFGSTVTVNSVHASWTMTLDLSASNYALTAVGITIGTRGGINGRAGTITCTGNWDSSAGAFTYGTSKLDMAGATKSLKMVAGQSLYNLGVTGATTLLSNIVVLHNFSMATTLSLGVYSLTNTGGWTYCTTDFTFATAGTFVAGIHLNVSGNFDISAITFTYGTSTVNMTGTSKTLKTGVAGTLYNLNISGTVSTITNSFTITHSFTVTTTGTFTIGGGLTATYAPTAGGALINRGTIGATGTFYADFSTADVSASFGIVNAPTTVRALAGATANRICTMGAAATFGSTLTISSAHGSNTMTLDLSASNYALSATDLTIGTRGVVNGRGSAITCSGNWDSSAGAFTYGTSNVIMSGTTKTLKMLGGQSLYDLSVTGTIALLSAIVATHTITVTGGTLDLSASNYALTAVGITIGASGSINGRGSLIVDSGDWDSSAGSFTYGTSNLIMSGTTKTLKMAGGQSLYDLNVTGTISLLSAIITTHTVTATGGALDLSASNYALTAVGITIGVSGVINGRGSVLTCSGNWDSNAGTFIYGTSSVVMTGTTKTLKTATSAMFYNLQISGTVSTTSSVNISYGLTVDLGKVFTIGAVKIVDFNCSAGGTYSNLGSIIGTGTIYYSFNTADTTITFGTVDAPAIIRAYANAIGNRICTLGATTTFGSSLTVASAHPTWAITLDDGANQLLGVWGATILGSEGIMIQGSGTWTFWGTFTENSGTALFEAGGTINYLNGVTISAGTFNANNAYLLIGHNWDSSGGWFNGMNSVANMSMLGAVAHTAYGYPFNTLNLLVGGSVQANPVLHAKNLTIQTGAELIVLTNGTTVFRFLDLNGTISSAGWFVNITASNTNVGYLNGIWNGNIALNGTALFYSIYTRCPMTGSLYTNRTMYLSVNSTSDSIKVTPTSAWTNITMLYISTAPFAIGVIVAEWWAGTNATPAQVEWILTLRPSTDYSAKFDGVQIALATSSILGLFPLTYTGVWSAHLITITVSTVPTGGGGGAGGEGAFIQIEISIKQNGPYVEMRVVVISGNPIIYQWSFGDGAYADGKNATHMYTALGNYTITLTAIDSAGHIAIAEKLINIKSLTMTTWSIWDYFQILIPLMFVLAGGFMLMAGQRPWKLAGAGVVILGVVVMFFTLKGF
jgi:hypothetical protein